MYSMVTVRVFLSLSLSIPSHFISLSTLASHFTTRRTTFCLLLSFFTRMDHHQPKTRAGVFTESVPSHSIERVEVNNDPMTQEDHRNMAKTYHNLAEEHRNLPKVAKISYFCEVSLSHTHTLFALRRRSSPKPMGMRNRLRTITLLRHKS